MKTVWSGCAQFSGRSGDRGATILLASHNKEDIAALCDRIFKMAEGRLAEVMDSQAKPEGEA